MFHERKSEKIERKFETQNPYLSHWVPEDWPHYIACTPAMLLILRQIGQFFKIHKKYCCRLGLVDNALLGMIKPKILPWNLTQALPREALIYLLQALLIILSTVCVTSLQVNKNTISTAAKGQMKSECIYEIIDFPKYHQKNLIDFSPESLFRLGMLCTHLSRVALRIIKTNHMCLSL